jgi:hypothetical protein
MKHLWDQHRFAVSAFVIAIVCLGYFAFQTASSAIYWMDPAHQDQDLAAWMTPRYVAQSYKLPQMCLALRCFWSKAKTPRRVSLGTIAAENGLTLDDLQLRIDAAATQWREVQK